MKLTDFDFALPTDRIAQYLLSERSASRLMVLHRNSKRWEHRRFSDILEYLRPGDALVLNDTKVIPARLIGRRTKTGGKIAGLHFTEELLKAIMTQGARHSLWPEKFVSSAVCADLSFARCESPRALRSGKCMRRSVKMKWRR